MLGRPTPEQMRAMRNGVLLTDGITAPAQVKVISTNNGKSYLEVIIHEGRNRQIRRMCETVGITLLELQRVKFGPIPLNNLKIGAYRKVTAEELSKLRLASSKDQH